MSPEVLARKLERLREFLADLRRFQGASVDAVEEGLIPGDLGERLERATGLRNILVHLYEEVDLEILTDSVRPALDDFGEVLTIFQRRLEEMGE